MQVTVSHGHQDPSVHMERMCTFACVRRGGNRGGAWRFPWAGQALPLAFGAHHSLCTQSRLPVMVRSRHVSVALTVATAAVLLHVVAAQGCPNECSQQGTCTYDNTCVCNSGYTLPDCSGST